MTLQLHLPLHDDSATDYSGNGNDGTLNGGVTTGVAGRGGLEAMSFDGSDDYIDISGVSALSSFTFCMWVRPPDGSDSTPVSFRENNDFRFQINKNGNGNMSGVLYDGSSTNTVTGTLPKNEWSHWACAWDGSTLYLYKNGSQVDSVTVSANNDPNVGDFISEFDGSANAAHLFNGQVFDVRAYSRALSSSEIQTLYEWGSGDYARPPTDGVSRYALDGDATDVWGSNDGTNNGVTFVSDSIRGQSGKFGGTSDWIDIPHSTAFESNYVTISFWLNVTDTDSRVVTTNTNNETDIYDTWVNTSGQLRATVHVSGTAYRTTSSSAINGGEWRHFTLVYDGSAVMLYINGVLDSQNTNPSGTSDNPTDGFNIGADNDGGQRFLTGQLDDVRFYDYALEPYEVHDLYQWGTFGRDLRKHLVTA